eukprot:5189164-Pleurochrysis_carterae.AAC.1
MRRKARHRHFAQDWPKALVEQLLDHRFRRHAELIVDALLGVHKPEWLDLARGRHEVTHANANALDAAR